MKQNLLLIITICTILVFPKVTQAQAPTLGASSSFALFTSAGAFSNTGATTIITGDIGTNVGSITGFPPGTVIGQIHEADSVSAQAALDVDTAYTYLDSLTCDSNIGAAMGGNQTLTPMVYCIPTATTLTGDLILDAQGDTNAVFIFKINGTFASAAFSRVLLINSASLKNIYWQINGSVALGDSSIFTGTIVGNGTISLSQGSFLLGRGLTRAGAISIDNSLSTLPVKLLSFNATYSHEQVLLTWSTVMETNNEYYSIERCTNGMNWKNIGKVSGAKNSSALQRYIFLDKDPNKGTNYYRLKQTDFDGKFEYSAVVPIGNDVRDAGELTIFPNPTNGKFNVSFNSNRNEFQSVSIYTITGENVYHSVSDLSTIDVSNLKEGVYFLHLTSSTRDIARKLVIIK